MTQREPSTKLGILMFFTLFIAYITFAANWVGGSSLTPEIINTFFKGEVSSVVSQVVNYTITIGRVIANFGAAFLLAKLGIRKAGLLALGLLMFSLVAVWMPEYWIYVIARMVMALGGSLVMVYMNPIVAKFVRRKHKMLFSAFITAGYNIGAFILSISFIFWAKALRADWRITMTFVALLSIVTFLVWLKKAQNFHAMDSDDKHPAFTYKQAITSPFIWLFSLGLGAFLFLYVMSLTTVPSSIASVHSHFTEGLMICAVSGGGIIGTFFISRTSLNIKRRPYLMIVGILTLFLLGIALTLTSHPSPLTYLLFGLVGFLILIQYPVYLNIPHELEQMTPQKSTVMFGMIWTLTYSLYTILNIIWSLLFDLGGLTLAHLFYIATGLIYLLAIYLIPESFQK